QFTLLQLPGGLLAELFGRRGLHGGTWGLCPPPPQVRACQRWCGCVPRPCASFSYYDRVLRNM
ncbi:hypothetical protein ACJX0J_008211, partial [Zea mays]